MKKPTLHFKEPSSGRGDSSSQSTLMYMKRLCVMLLMAVSYCASAQTYTLQDCIRAAMANNQQLMNSKLDMSAADYRIREIKSALLPTIDINGQLLYYQDVPSQYAPASAFGGSSSEYTKLTMSMAQTTSGNLQVSQNLYNQSVLIGVKAAKATQEASALQELVTRESIVYNVSSTYYSVQVLADNLDRLAENIRNLEKTAQINAILKENEIVSANVHNRMLINLENLRNQYDNQSLLYDKNITLLKHLMNVDIGEEIKISSFDYTESFTLDESDDITQRPDLMLQQAQIRLSEFDKKSVAAGYYPVLTNTATFGYSGYYDSFAPHKQINNDWIKTSSFALTLKIPVFDGFRKQNQLRQKEIAIQKNLNTLSLMKSSANKELIDAKENYIANRNLLASNKKSLDLAEQLFSSSQSEYENGITSITEFLNAQNDLTTARTNYSNALLNLKLAELSLKKANGTLLTNQ
ncbi:MAG TPA: TolC family protein [Chryseolinea sp.]